MLEAKNVGNSLSLIDTVKTVNKEELLEFAKSYLSKHVYVSSKKLGMEYLGIYYNLTSSSMDYNKIKKVLANKFRHIISLLVREGLIAGYNNNSLYKRVDIVKSLSTDSSKTSNQILQKTVISSSKTEPETNEVKLVYYQGKFINPKFYDKINIDSM